MKHWIPAALGVALALASPGAYAAERVPVEAFAESDAVTSPRLSPDGRHLAVSADLGGGNHAVDAIHDDRVVAAAQVRGNGEVPAIGR